MSDHQEAKQATPPETLLAELLDSRVPKSEREHAAKREIERLRAERADLRDVLLRNGFVPCDSPACNCGSWHARFGLPERMREIHDALSDAGHPLSNGNGNLAINALRQLVADRDEREAKMLAEIDRLRAAVQHEADCVEAAKAEIDRLTRERDEARAEREALANVLPRAGDEIERSAHGGDDLMSWASAADVLRGALYDDYDALLDCAKALRGLVDFAKDSLGISGYHLNGEILEWDDVEELHAGMDALHRLSAGVEANTQIDALAKDAARYRWLRDVSLGHDSTADPDNYTVVWHGTDPAKTTRARTLDDAVDAALAQIEQERPE